MTSWQSEQYSPAHSLPQMQRFAPGCQVHSWQQWGQRTVLPGALRTDTTSEQAGQHVVSAMAPLPLRCGAIKGPASILHHDAPPVKSRRCTPRAAPVGSIPS